MLVITILCSAIFPLASTELVWEETVFVAASQESVKEIANHLKIVVYVLASLYNRNHYVLVCSSDHVQQFPSSQLEWCIVS